MDPLCHVAAIAMRSPQLTRVVWQGSSQVGAEGGRAAASYRVMCTLIVDTTNPSFLLPWMVSECVRRMAACEGAQPGAQHQQQLHTSPHILQSTV